MTNIKFKITFIIFLFVFLNVLGQNTELGYTTENHKVYSEDKDEYILKITFPRNYSSDKEYKTLYYLDAYWLTEITLGSYTILDLCDYVEDVVFVGISLNGTQKEWNKQRDMDFTPSQFKNLGLLDDLKKSNLDNNIKITVKTGSGNQLNNESTGGANLFLDFLENQVIEFVEKQYPNLNKRRGLLGHSFGGLFGFYTLQNRPELFQDLLLISASLSWNSSELVVKENFSKLKESKSKIKLYHSYGDKEIKGIRTSNNGVNNILTELELENLNYKFEPVKNANHHSVLSRAIYDGLLYLYKN
ncbi:Predicted hydrolase of the alpha/beta superfamily [Maribacter sedimenticola]|uniref:Predicted hydrolase of the alpha/beta superfamily n=1 Tax=Maribacter sedimenticola TaxID=228956 RepID=A0ABY1SL61_9FLAO|nr:alpha/beta hydrolase-fold protein [Maribacter sedimenticola]SNR74205.1 Predicted hydrolase of the alpha/beta superfamily [Maribacter sedimenticola]